MSVSEAELGESVLVVRVKSSDAKLRRHLENLGIMSGAELMPLSYADGNVILRVHDSRIAINRDVADNIMVSKRPAIA